MALRAADCAARRICRGYSQKKLTENMDAEIMQVILDEAREAYPELNVVERRSDSIEDLESNVQRAVQWVQNWCASNEKTS